MSVTFIDNLPGLTEVPAVKPEFRHLYAGRPKAHCWVYEVWDDLGRLAYVGLADSFERRWRQHVSFSWWLGEIEIWYVSVAGYRSRGEARQVEACAINEQNPVYNTARELKAYAEYRELYENPERPIDDWDCIPVAKRQFVAAKAVA